MLKITLTAVAMTLLWTVGPSCAIADPIPIDELALRAGKGIYLGKATVVDAAIAAKKSVTADKEVHLGGIYSFENIYLGRDAVVRGTVMAEKSASADRNLDLVGDWTGKGVSFGRDATVVGNVTAASQQIGIGRNADITGNVRGNHNIWIDRDSTITGDARPGIGRTLSTGGNVTITGSRDPGSVTVPDMGSSSVLDMNAPSHGDHGSRNIWRGNNSVFALDPGAYREVGFGHHATLNLSAGEYTLKTFWMDHDGQVNVDTSGGDVVLNVLNAFSTGHDVHFVKSGVGSLTINAYNSDIWLGNGADLAASICVFGGNFGAGNGMVLEGNVFASGQITLGNGSQITWSGGSPAVPEPGTVVLLALGAVGMLWKHKNRR